jgi:SAM-dependent methyltransferase
MIPDRSTFESAYAGQAPWDIGRPQKPFIDVADHITGTVLDAGCGTGDTALFLAGRGRNVTGIDFLAVPIHRAQRKAADRGVKVTFLVKDALMLNDWTERFDHVVDSGLFHVFSDEDRRRYVEGLATVLKAGGRLFLLCFSDEEPREQGPRRVSKAELRAAFAGGWSIESIEPARIEVRPDFKEFSFSEGGPKAWCERWREATTVCNSERGPRLSPGASRFVAGIVAVPIAAIVATCCRSNSFSFIDFRLPPRGLEPLS